MPAPSRHLLTRSRACYKSMWYVIQTFTGKEQEVCTCINLKVDHSLFSRCFVPLYEDVWRQGGVGHISVKRVFPGYVFIETDRVVDLYMELKRFPKLTILLYTTNEEIKDFPPLHEEEEVFFDTILSDGLMRVSFVHLISKGRIVIGPLGSYTEHIVKVDIAHRRALVEIPMLGETRRVKFGLWTDRDEKILWIEEAKGLGVKNEDIAAVDIKPGDKVICIRGIYGDKPLEVAEVKLKKNSVLLNVPMFGSLTKVEMGFEDVVKA